MNASATDTPCRAVLLHHRLPDSSEHIDWLFERYSGSPLVAFRTTARPDQDASGFIAQRIPDHRAAYLTFEGPINGDRGDVRRLAAGWSILRVDTGHALTVDQDWGGGWSRFTGESIARGVAGAIWRFLSTRLILRDDATPGIL